MKTNTNHNSSNTYTLITGASEGIGRALAENCARRGWNLILVALPGKELHETEAYLTKKYNVSVYSYAIDLTSADSCQEICDWLNANNMRINMLINNAGLGSSGLFEHLSANMYLKQVQLNVTAVTLMTRLLIHDLIENSPSYILNVGSLAGFCCIPYKSLYTATKSFVNTFTLSLREELSDNNIHVTALCPGPVKTNEGCRSRTQKHGFIARMSQTDTFFVAEKAINGLLARKPIVIPGLINRLLFVMNQILPKTLKIKLMKNEFKKELV